jgi:hypothetical protein
LPEGHTLGSELEAHTTHMVDRVSTYTVLSCLCSLQAMARVHVLARSQSEDPEC